MEKVLYREEQSFNQRWIWLILIPATVSVFGVIGFAFDKQLLNGKPWGDNPMSDLALIIIGIFIILLMLGLSFLFYKMKLVIEVKADGIYYRYPPMIRKFRKIAKETIDRFEIRIYKPIREYGGWGIKTQANPKKRNKTGVAYNVKGNIGLQLYLKDGKKILIGTQRKDALKFAVDKMMKNTRN